MHGFDHLAFEVYCPAGAFAGRNKALGAFDVCVAWHEGLLAGLDMFWVDEGFAVKPEPMTFRGFRRKSIHIL